MAKHLQQITGPLGRYLQSRFQHALKSPSRSDDNQLPPPVRVAFLRGEALFRQHFFDYLEQRHITDPQSQLFFWDKFCANQDFLPRVSENMGLPRHFGNQVPQGWIDRSENERIHYTAYCCLIWDLHQQNETALFTMAIDGLITHYASSLFPSQARTRHPAQLKKAIATELARRWHIRPLIKESFTTDPDHVDFALIARPAGYHPVELIRISGQRLNQTRIKACRLLLSQLEQDSAAIPALIARAPNKNDPIAPLPVGKQASKRP